MTARWNYVAIGALSVALFALVVFTVIKVNDLNSKVSKLDGTTSALQQETSGADQTALKEQQAALRTVTAKLKKVESCIPEMQTELNSEKVERVGYVEITSQVSSYCNGVVYGTGP